MFFAKTDKCTTQLSLVLTWLGEWSHPTYLWSTDPDNKVHGAHIRPIWDRQGPGGPHVGPMNFAIWGPIPWSRPGYRWNHASWWRHQMETFSALLARCLGNSPVTGEFSSQTPVMWSFEVFLDMRQNKLLSKQSRRWGFETPPRSLWCHCNVFCVTVTRTQQPSNWRWTYCGFVTSCLYQCWSTLVQVISCEFLLPSHCP